MRTLNQGASARPGCVVHRALEGPGLHALHTHTRSLLPFRLGCVDASPLTFMAVPSAFLAFLASGKFQEGRERKLFLRQNMH